MISVIFIWIYVLIIYISSIYFTIQATENYSNSNLPRRVSLNYLLRMVSFGKNFVLGMVQYSEKIITNILGPNFFNLKLIWLSHLLSSASLFKLGVRLNKVPANKVPANKARVKMSTVHPPHPTRVGLPNPT